MCAWLLPVEKKSLIQNYKLWADNKDKTGWGFIPKDILAKSYLPQDDTSALVHETKAYFHGNTLIQHECFSAKWPDTCIHHEEEPRPGQRCAVQNILTRVWKIIQQHVSFWKLLQTLGNCLVWPLIKEAIWVFFLLSCCGPFSLQFHNKRKQNRHK